MAATKKTEQTVTKKAEPVVTETVVEKVTEKKFNKGDMIPCHSIAGGITILVGSKTNDRYTWIDNGDVVEVAYEDLMDEVRKANKRGILYIPLIVVDDEDFVNQNKAIKELYESMYTTRDLIDILNLPASDMIDVIRKLPSSVADLLKPMVSARISNGSIDSVSKIKALDEFFGTKFMLLTEMFES